MSARILVDELQVWPNAKGGFRGGSCHLTVEGLTGRATDEEEKSKLEALHAFAARIGLKRAWFQDHPLAPHYDLTHGKRETALRAGATFVPGREQAAARLDARAKVPT